MTEVSAATPLSGNWNYPTTMRFGVGRIKELPQCCRNLGMTRPLLVTDSGLADRDIVKDAVAANDAVGAAIRAFDLLTESAGPRLRLHDNSRYFRAGLEGLGFTLVPGEHPIIPVMLGNAALATAMAARLLDEGIYVIGFSYPVVPQGSARIRTQVSAAHDRGQLDRALADFAKVGRGLGVI